MRYRLFTLCISLVTSLIAKSQCAPPTPISANVCGDGVPLQDNANIATGEIHSFNGTGGVFSNISLSGGTLILCGSVTITDVNFNSGEIDIKPGATVVFNGNFNTGSNMSFHNQGNTTFNVNVAIQGATNFIFNASGATITVNGDMTVFNSGIFINDGLAAAQNVLLNSGASICLGGGSVCNVVSVQNNAATPVSVANGLACISYSSSFTGNAAITASPALQICQNPAATNPDPVAVGSATVMPNCPACPQGAVTPLRLISFNGSTVNGMARLKWETAYEENVRSFVVQHSGDGSYFDSVGSVVAHNQPSTYNFNTVIQADSYYRLKMVDIDGQFTYSPVIFLAVNTGNFKFMILSNPVNKDYAELSIATPANQNGQLVVVDYTGKTLKRVSVKLTRGNNIIHLDLAGVNKGQYFIQFIGDGGGRKVIPFVKL